MVDIILKCKNNDGRVKEYLRFKGGVTLLVGDKVSILTSKETMYKIMVKENENQEK